MRKPLPKRVLIAVAVAVAAVAFPSSAAGRPSGLSIALKKAYQLWHVAPCGGHYRVLFSLRPGNDQNAGYAKFNTPAGPEQYTTDPSTWTGCALVLNAAEWTPDQVYMNWSTLCTIVMHEWGHLIGHVHSDEPQFSNAPGVSPETREQLSVMKSGTFLSDWSADVKRCGIERP